MANTLLIERSLNLTTSQSDLASQPVLSIRPATIGDMGAIQRIVQAAWPVAFGEILTPEFLQHELNRVYSDEALQALTSAGERFLLAESGGKALGFAAYRIIETSSNKVGKLEKLYLMPSLKGKGYGKALISTVIALTDEAGCEELLLNVNRANPAVRFYEHMGFTIIREEDIEVGPNFFRNDYVMRRPLP